MKGAKVGKTIGWVFVGVGIAAAMGLVFGLFLQWLWNQLMPGIFGLPTITYWQAVGLFILSHLLFKSHSSHRSHDEEHNHWFGKRRGKASSRKEDDDRVTEKIRRMLDDGPKAQSPQEQ